MSLIVSAPELDTSAAVPSKTRLTIADDVGFNEAREIAETVIRMGDSSNWWIGDALLYLERFRRQYPDALDQLDRTYASLKVLRWVASCLAPVTRVTGLSWTHHRLVAPLDDGPQRYFLDEALRHGWTTRDLEDAVAATRGTGARPPALTVRAAGELYALCTRAAERAGMSPADWAARALESAARLELAGEA